MPTTNRRPPSFYNLLFLNILHRLLCYWLGRNRSAPISTYISHLKTLLLIADGNPRSGRYRINGLVPLPLSNSSSYIITRDPRKRKDNIITQRQNFRAAIGFYAVILETHLPTLWALWWPFRQPISSFALAVQTLLCRPAPQAFAASTLLYPAISARNLKEQQRIVVERGEIRPDQSPYRSPISRQDGPKPSCPDLWNHKRSGDQGPMSQRPAASRPVSQPTAGGLNDRSPTDTFRGQDGQGAGLDHGDGISREQPLQQLSHQPATEPLAQTYPPMAPGDSRTPTGASRGVGVHTMLNPTESGTGGVSSTFGSNSPMPLADRSRSQHITGADTPTLTPRLNHPPNSPSLLSANTGFAGRRRRSLVSNAHRSVSLGNQAMGVQRPFVQPPAEKETGWSHVVAPGSGTSSEIPPVPAISTHIRSPINLPPPVSGPPLNRRASVAVIGGPTARLPNSQSASPNSPYSYSSYPSPAPITQMSQPPVSQPHFAGPVLRGAFLEGGPPQGNQQEPGPYITHPSERTALQPPPSGGHDLVLTIENGEFVVPVDVDVGSIEAGNRRRRNAYASARFRQRGKERKLQESKEINELEQKLQDMSKELQIRTEQRDFYQNERSRLRQILYDNPETRDRAIQAPQSPRFAAQSPPHHDPPSGALFQTGGDTSQSERPSRKRRLNYQGERGDTTNKSRAVGGQNIQYAPPTTLHPPTTTYAPALPRPDEGQHPQYFPPHARSVSGPESWSMWPSDVAAQRPPPAFYPQGGGDRSWRTGQLPQPPQASQQPQLSQQQPQQPQQQSQQQSQYQTQHQVQHQPQQQSQHPPRPQGDTSGQR